MRKLATGILIGLAALGVAQARTAPEPGDPHRWLEDVDGERALQWVAARNAAAESELAVGAGHAALRTRLQTILDSKERIPYATRHGDYYYNFWRDATHPRGLWRRTSPQEYRKAAPQWETVLDLDRLAHDENENWVWAGATCLKPRGQRCLVSLSRGGGDARVVREFDLAARAFVSDGFTLAEAKGNAAWIDRDTLFVATDFGPGSLTSSGYPRLVKEWRRGTPLAAARTVYEATPGDLSASAHKDFTPGFEREFVRRQIGFYSSELFLRADGKLVKVPKPDDANAIAWRDQLLIELRSDWHAGGKTYPQGSLLATDFAGFMRGERVFDVLFAPSPTVSLEGMSVTRGALLLNLLDNVKNRIVEFRREDGTWRQRAVAAPATGALGVSAVDPVESDQYFLTVTDFLTPTTLYLAEAGSDRRERLKAMPAFFDAAPHSVTQLEARSRDGTRVPYFVVMDRRTRLSGKNPTLLYG